jgi:hypothetical protein
MAWERMYIWQHYQGLQIILNLKQDLHYFVIIEIYIKNSICYESMQSLHAKIIHIFGISISYLANTSLVWWKINSSSLMFNV